MAIEMFLRKMVKTSGGNSCNDNLFILIALVAVAVVAGWQVYTGFGS